jgi:PAS domain S-box-containing protein
MRPSPGSPVSRALQGWCAAVAACSALAGSLVLVGGWALDVAPFALMKRSTALCFVLAGGALWLLDEPTVARRTRAVADAAAVLMAAVAGLSLPRALGAAEPGAPMAPLTALCFLLLGLSFLSLDRPRVFRTGQRLAVTVAFLGLLMVALWAYGSDTLPLRVGRLPDAAPLLGILLIALGVAVTTVRPGRGASGIFVQNTAGGMVARLGLPGTVLGSLLIGGLGLAGERANLWGHESSVALITVASLSLFSALVWFLAVRLHRTDAQRLAVERELRRVNAELEERVEARTRALADSEYRYRRVIDDSPNGIIIHQGDHDNAIRFVNPAGLQMFGHTETAQMIGRPMLDYIAPGDRDLVRERNAARLRSALPPGLIQVEALRADGSGFWINAAATVVDWEGHPATLVSFVDVSEQRRLQTAEREAESLRAVTRLANAAAHEINNPLTVVGGNIHLLAAKLNGRPELQRYIERALRGVQSIADMITHMTRVTRLTTLTSLDTAGMTILDLRGSSTGEPDPAVTPPVSGPGEPPRAS